MKWTKQNNQDWTFLNNRLLSYITYNNNDIKFWIATKDRPM